MSIASVITEIELQITRLQEARVLLAGEDVKRKPGRPSAVNKKRTVSPETRARIAAAQKKRWAAVGKMPK